MAQQVPEDPGPEYERRQHPAPPSVGVERHARPNDLHVHAGDTGVDTALPLAQGQIRDLMPVRCKSFREVPVPPFGAPDGVREEAVVDEANAHRAV